jgi:hypothetical protein
MDACQLCAYWQEGRCTHTWRLVVLVEPTGGQVDFATTPGMVPEELKPKLERYFRRLVDRLLPVIEAMPIWGEIREWQLAHPEAAACPGRRERAELRPYLQVVKWEP